MRTHRRPGSAPVLLALVAALLPAAAGAADPACEALVKTLVQKLERSRMMEVQLRVQAHLITGQLLGAIGQQAKLGTGWREGNPEWEEAYALYGPDLYASMKAAGEREMRRQEAKLPGALDPATCKKHLALLSTRTGALAARIDDALDMRDSLDSLEKGLGVPPRLKPLLEAARKELAPDAALLDDPATRSAEPTLPAVRKELRGYGKGYAEAVKRLGDGDVEGERKASGEAAEKMMARHKPAFSDLVRRFRAASVGR